MQLLNFISKLVRPSLDDEERDLEKKDESTPTSPFAPHQDRPIDVRPSMTETQRLRVYKAVDQAG